MVNPNPSVSLFIGNDDYSKEEAIRNLSSSLLDNSSKDVDYRIFRGGDPDLGGMLNYAATRPFTASRRLAVIKDFEKLSAAEKEMVFSYIKKPAASTCLVITAGGDSMLRECRDARRYADIRIFNLPESAAISSRAKKFLKDNGKTIDDDALLLLKELQAQNLSGLMNELEKLVSFTGKRDRITAGDVKEAVGRSIDSSAFDIAKAIGSGRIAEAMKIAFDLILIGKKHHEIVGGLCWHFKRMLRAKMLQAKGESDRSIGSILKIRREEGGEFFRQVRGTGISRLKRRMEILLDADIRIKRSRIDPALALELAIIELCL